jgi:hypothetical protein
VGGSKRNNDRDATPVNFTNRNKDADMVVEGRETWSYEEDTDDEDEDEGCAEVAEEVKMRVRAFLPLSSPLQLHTPEP